MFISSGSGLIRVEFKNDIFLIQGDDIPVVKNANKKSLKEIAKESKELAEKVKTGKLMPADQEGNTFTISNVGMYGITTFTPIINMPSSAILGVGATQDKFVPVNGEAKINERIKMTINKMLLLKNLLTAPFLIILSF